MVEKHTDDPILIAEIARQKNIPIKFLENILLSLKKAGFLESKKGKNGGYFFAIAPENIKLSSIFRIIEGPIALLPCVSLNFYEKCADCNEKKCGINKKNHLFRGGFKIIYIDKINVSSQNAL